MQLFAPITKKCRKTNCEIKQTIRYIQYLGMIMNKKLTSQKISSDITEICSVNVIYGRGPVCLNSGSENENEKITLSDFYSIIMTELSGKL